MKIRNTILIAIAFLLFGFLMAFAGWKLSQVDCGFEIARIFQESKITIRAEETEEVIAEDHPDPKNPAEANTEPLTAIAEPTTAEIKALIRETAQRYGVDSEKALRIAECESGFRNVCNEKYGCVSGIGIFQLTQSTFDEYAYNSPGYNLFSPHHIEDNIEVAIYLMSKEEWYRWDKSKSCWSRNPVKNETTGIPAICNTVCPPYLILDLHDCTCKRSVLCDEVNKC